MQVSHPGEDVCGDDRDVRLRDDRIAMMIADGLGHGLSAHDAAREATTVFRRLHEESPQRIVEDVHAALRSTRGAAVAVLAIDCARRINELNHDVPPGSVIVMVSDGLGTQWDLASYPGLRTRHPSVIAGVLYRGFSRRRDDVTIVVAKER